MDIVERLRRYRPIYGWPEERSVIVEPTMNHVAADEIERLRKKSEEDEELKAKAAEMIEELRLRNDRLRATLKMITSKSHSTIYEI